MHNHWIFIAKEPDFDLEKASKKILEEKMWDFVSSTTPSYARQLEKGHEVLFYLSEKDQNGKRLSQYHYPVFFACAILDSELDDIENSVKLKNMMLIEPPVKVIKPRDNFGIGRGPAIIVPIEKVQFDNVCKNRF